MKKKVLAPLFVLILCIGALAQIKPYQIKSSDQIKFNSNMKYAINLNPLLPTRAEGREGAEQVTQLVFGDYCQVLEDNNSGFVKIKNHFDGYEGWVDKKMLTEITKETYDSLCTEPVYRTFVPMAEACWTDDKSLIRLTAGSLLPHYDKATSTCDIAGRHLQIHPDFVTYLPGGNLAGVVATAKTFLNTPYLWGGKSILGIDCSGFSQTVFSINGISLLRDASQQVKEGVEVKNIEDAKPADLVFFQSKGKIVHVGIYIGNNRVIHSSGHVRIDSIDSKGIWMPERGYTHSLAAIRRIQE